MESYLLVSLRGFFHKKTNSQIPSSKIKDFT